MPYHKFIQIGIETPDYLTDAKALGLTADERKAIVDYIAHSPDTGNEMKANLSQAERNELKQILGTLADTYKKEVKRYVASRK